MYKAKHGLINERQNISFLAFRIGQIRWEKRREGEEEEEEEEEKRRRKEEGEKKSNGMECLELLYGYVRNFGMNLCMEICMEIVRILYE